MSKSTFLKWVLLLTISGGWCYGQGNALSLQELLVKARKAPPVQYEILTTTVHDGQTGPVSSESKVWQKGPYQKIETVLFGGKITAIVRPDGYYIYAPGKDQYVRQGGAELSESMLASLLKNKNATLTVVGDGMIDGKGCTIVKALIMVYQGKPPLTEKYWIWNKNGLVVRIENTLARGAHNFTTLREMKKFVFDDIPDGVFAVPKEKIVDNPAVGVQNSLNEP